MKVQLFASATLMLLSAVPGAFSAEATVNRNKGTEVRSFPILIIFSFHLLLLIFVQPHLLLLSVFFYSNVTVTLGVIVIINMLGVMTQQSLCVGLLKRAHGIAMLEDANLAAGL